MIETDANRLAMIKAVGGEQFDTGLPDRLWGIFDREFVESVTGNHVIENRQPMIQCRTSDVSAHSLVKQSAIRRIADDSTYRVLRFEDDGTGMTQVLLRS